MWLINYHPIPFLNCLCGSEQVNKTAVNRFNRIHPFYFLFYQSFIFFYSYQSLWAFPDFCHEIGCRLLSSTQKNSLKSPGRAPKAPWGIQEVFLWSFQPADREAIIGKGGDPAFHGCAQAGCGGRSSGLLASLSIESFWPQRCLTGCRKGGGERV